MRKKVFAVIQYLFFLGLGIFLMWWQLSKMTPGQSTQFRESLLHARYIVILPVALVALISHWARARRWKIMIEPMGYHPSTANTFYSVMCGYLANTFIPRAGEILRCTMLGRYEKIPVNKLVGTIVTERVFDLVSYFFVIVITILIQIDTVSDFVKNKIEEIKAQHASFPWLQLFIGLIIVAIVFVIIMRWIFRKYADHKHILTIKGIFTGLKEGITTIFRLKKRRAFILWSCFIWGMYLLEIYTGFFALKATSGLGIGAAFSVLSLATLAMLILPGGIGAFPVAIQQVLLIYNIDNISFGWLIWGATTAIIVIAGLISLGLLIYTNRRKNEAKQQNT
ncbi:MAG TPA: lysylphosphatidylglycerol synthase transmembrane domain-containing protein [Chitinophagaceae bacterium]|nr:lysylphosphatidylglycerol synthase transmembrane domain-containing protein [Chitinophagaceae bacterium]